MKYQEKVNSSRDVKALYEKVIADPNIQWYRGVDDGKSYVWDKEAEDYKVCTGEMWFENPSYDPNCKHQVTEVCEKVSHPSHYTYGKIECIDFILDKQLDFPLGNAVKYIVRAGHKSEEGMTEHDKTIEDLKKAIQYIQFEIEHLEGKR
jgi:hypothetical protein